MSKQLSYIFRKGYPRRVQKRLPSHWQDYPTQRYELSLNVILMLIKSYITYLINDY